MERDIFDYPGAFNAWLGRAILAHRDAAAWTWHGVGLLLVLLAFLEARRPLRSCPRVLRALLASDAAFLGLASALTVVLRLPLLSVLHELNPDESQYIVGAGTLVKDWRFWQSVDCGSSGPLNVAPLALIHVFGGALHYGGVRLWATLACIVPTFVLVYRALRQHLDVSASRLLLMPLVVLFALPTHADFAAYNSEHVPMLLTAAVLLLGRRVVASPDPGLRAVAALGLLLGCFPYTKLQAISGGLACGAVVLGVLLLRKAGRPAAVLVLGAALPTAVVLLALWSYDGFEHFWQSYVVTNLGYASSGGFGESLPGSVLDKLPVLVGMYGLCKEHMLSMVALVVLSLAVLAWRTARGRVGWVPDARSLLSWAVLLGFLYGVVKPGNEFGHYLLLLAVPCVLVCSHLVGSAALSPGTAVLRYSFAAATVLLPWAWALSTGALGLRDAGAPETYLTRTKAADLVRSLAGPNARIAVWGWETQLFIYAGCIQATKESHTYYQVTARDQHEYYMRRYLSDLERNRPRVLVDAVGEEAYCFTSPQHRADQYPGIREYVAQNYRLVAEIEGKRIYTIR